ncbi:hypothetical protein Psal006b_02433 [Piscirickettsia salmonis]|uniref:TerB n=1 Tax=Piscirickettsia salmonis TaxID=1238 RepID=A0A1L6T9U0_PISSA|nr:hypothetical protein [Piscirickettsia salmonis]AKP73269.1 hypothetical protein PSLF89_1312 [Piscirickettsia salmonis LF-89 = ATCC VR-1361]ALB21963.1 TerB [Piscirickettsia salmonis]ALY02121.1 hypothetical protein AWE47_03945 [Piscirickettsia salmonis]AMA41635.1 hypothetical protein AWJ11_03940 [Piscirickettsia salmonis]AOS34118.1 hypothetical protein AVM72_01175 [Piscirickettsia salmonis]
MDTLIKKKPTQTSSSSYFKEGILLGLCHGIMADNQILDEELIFLKDWIYSQIELTEEHPGSDIVKLINIALEEHPVRPATMQSLIEGFEAIFSAYQNREDPWAVFIGLCYGVLADDVIAPADIELLLNWLEEHPEVKVQSQLEVLLPSLYQTRTANLSLDKVKIELYDFIQMLDK